MQVSNVGNAGYIPRVSNFTGKKSSTPENFELKYDLYTPEGEEKSSQKENAFKVLGGVILTAGALVVIKNTKFGKNLLKRIRDLFGAKSAENVVKPSKSKKAKVKTQRKIIKEHADLAPSQKVKMKNNGGKDAARKVRRNKKSIIQETKLREEAEAFTEKDLEAYHQSLGTPATAAEREFITKNNRPATNSMVDIMSSQGIQRTKNSNGRIVLQTEQRMKPISEPLIDNAGNTVSVSDKITSLRADIAKQDEMITKYSQPNMKRWAKPYEARRAKLVQELQQLEESVRLSNAA